MLYRFLRFLRLPNVPAANMPYLAVQMVSGHAVDNKHARSALCARQATADSVLSLSPLETVLLQEQQSMSCMASMTLLLPAGLDQG